MKILCLLSGELSDVVYLDCDKLVKDTTYNVLYETEVLGMGIAQVYVEVKPDYYGKLRNLCKECKVNIKAITEETAC